MDDFCGSKFWDTDLTWNTKSPDLTPCFEKTVLVWVPCAYLWIFAVLDLFKSSYSRHVISPVPWSPLNILKIAFTILLASLDFLILLIMRGVIFSKEDVYNADVYAPAVKIATYILFVALLLYSKGRGVQSSGVQSLFWLFLWLCEAVTFRTALLEVKNTSFSNDQETHSTTVFLFVLKVIYFPVVAGMFVLHMFPDARPQYEHINLKDKPCPEIASSFFSQLLFHWFTPLAWRGFRKPLEFPDLWDLNPQDRSKFIVPGWDKNYPKDLNRTYQHAKQNGSSSVSKKETFEESMIVKFANDPKKDDVSIMGASLKTFGPSYGFAILLKLIPDLLVFVSPQILNLLIDFVEADEETSPLWKGVLYALVLFGSAFLGTVITCQATHRFYLAGMNGRTALVSAIYRKALILSNAAKRESTVGEIVNLMSVDVQRCTEFAQYAYFLWSGPILIGLAVYFLWGILGPASLAGLGVMVLMLPVNAIIAGKIRKLQVVQMKQKDDRVKLMNEMLSGIRVLKLYAWEPCFEKQITDIRRIELDVLKKTAFLNAYSNVLWTCAPFLVAIGTFGTYVFLDERNVLDAHKIFVSISLFNVMSIPLTFLPLVIVNLVQAIVAIKRINKYMNSEEIEVANVTHDESEQDPIVIKNGSFSWEANGSPTLQNLEFRVADGSMVAVVGVVGSGKSSLLSALLGELNKVSGWVNTKGTVAYVAQQAWIQNATLRDNILFGKPFDPIKYDKVIEACALKPDLLILTAGDMTEIGEKGINLSGGQKQRVALARAAYSNASLFLFDDPLSAVDSHVGKHIFDKLLGPKGMLKRKTRVLVTHGVVYLPTMDNIFVLKNGEISESGTYQQLLDKKGAFADFLSQHMTSEDVSELEGAGMISEVESVLGDKAITGIKEKKRRPSESGPSDSEFVNSTESAIRRRLGSSVIDLTKIDEKSRRISHASLHASVEAGIDKLIDVEKSETEGVKASVYFDYFRAAGWIITISTFFLYFAFQGFAVGANLWLSEWSAQPANVNGTQDAGTRNYYLGIYGGLGILQAIAILGGTVMLATGTVKSAEGLHVKMLKRILQAPMHFFDTTPIGRIVNRFAKDVDILDSILPMFLRYLLNGIFNVFATLVVISISTPIFTAVVIPITLFYYLIQKFYVASSRQLKRLESVTRSPIYSHFGETVAGASTIRAYREQERFILDSENKVDHNQISFYCSIAANRWLAIRLETVGNLVVLFAALFAVLGRETMSPGIVGLSVSYALQITGGLLMLVRFTSDVETNIVAVERINEYSEAPQEASWEIPSRKPPPSWPENGEVTLDSYQTRYRPGLGLVLKNINCTIKPGEKVGIVGRTGAGKSSLTLALFRIIEPTGGTITIDGQDICRLGLHDVRGRITIIPQDPVLFSGSLRMNLDPFESYSDEKIWHTLELSHLKTFVKSLPAGLSHEIAEGGENLSVGQRQLVCLARALLRKTKILVLDEATAAVDLDTDDLIQQTIRKEFHDSTVITIAHRLNTIMDSTRVLVLDKGEIKEFDTPQNLLNDSNSIFAGMAKDAGL